MTFPFIESGFLTLLDETLADEVHDVRDADARRAAHNDHMNAPGLLPRSRRRPPSPALHAACVEASLRDHPKSASSVQPLELQHLPRPERHVVPLGERREELQGERRAS